MPTISFEYFPPKTADGKTALLERTTPALQALDPSFFSVTYGAGGSTRDSTFGVVSALCEQGIDVAPHLSFGGDGEDTIRDLLKRYRELGVRRLVALRGDMPSGMGGASQLVYASQLVSFIREHSGDYFHIEVAAYPEIHPQAESYNSDLRFLKEKLDAGANSAITQYFYNVESYFYFLDQCAAIGIDKPIVAGIMPITNFANLARFSRNCGAEIPRWICQRIEGYGNDQESIRQFGVEVVTQLCQTLLENGAPGLHFYTMNQVEPTRQIRNNLGL
ncbi:MAG TPA: methylenetetrahydrofolate reductase [NAD(P)H] [Halieaceae bacterium]|jgi:methylenetetrahydrofolate reductase (NADPH)|uniref:methylenetetrahydrofolate reductase [NAD(P)H] n=1 Tax=Haliea TaxID=475794 RepID=UPI00040D55DA|nr:MULTISPECIES: methylenetetrahydrofolate reductase [NAD(P)H] [Haliea]HBQ41323.1 methylenetetrahydrofolate reductase [NAD(P)H] [Halieaceae bacterium]MAD64109.1 methylenetetrahydrofolate reductase [NAD(P)H] [Haliea sp.]MAY92515.1 methylenetetrahydrofolate reductase [NAD(P)H] [Haliea sp.]MBK40857.1 methylenetetrahydrofolate reductase [NAD(P)H] [Haliea sp.]MBP68568.1 methylenetetrahydrofolate reductase [NAD(P)H] [Haliea sp.]|tara:strand:+ start:1751 stop:2578 length:828 start_codon:yes stop_codon:yes gene_type:complete